ncbi:hypothetical protein GTZ89_26315 [Streptomyces sp. SID8382]|uniref:hypothetical protein n=1 Tax=Streptomyces malaysiensis TaxID=92644 RepID=UPI000C2B6BCD|nr:MULTISPECIES: hypothetical protein [unclassified Streptomyces]AUA17266.1 hypothetical protein CFP59_09460 [Streptomyces sp. M56]MYX59083.1 hypothetical protein [Streptomyces sp. SID8382]
MANEAATYDERLRDLEAEAFRTGRTLAEHSEQLATIGEQQRTAFGNIDSLANAVGAPGDRSITQRLDGIEHAVGTMGDAIGSMQRLLVALARAQGVDPDSLS